MDYHAMTCTQGTNRTTHTNSGISNHCTGNQGLMHKKKKNLSVDVIVYLNIYTHILLGIMN